MNPDDKYIRRGKIIVSISFAFLITAIGLFVLKNIDLSKKDYTIAYETIDIKAMGVAKVSLKKENKDNVISTIVSNLEKKSTLTEVALVRNKTNDETSKVEQIAASTKPVWRLPTEQGYITQYAHYNHIALDITSARGTNERIYPVADGVVTSILHDNYGAKIVTINHYINGTYYTSQYVHLSWFAEGLHVGQQVTTDTILGGMGATGIATGVHLHLTVMDCNLYDVNDSNCSTIGKFYNYGRIRTTQGFYGLNNLMHVPHSWYSR